MFSPITNYVKYNYFEVMVASIMSRCDIKSSQISAQDTLLASRVMISCTTFGFRVWVSSECAYISHSLCHLIDVGCGLVLRFLSPTAATT